ncbi:Imm26 family immunity protein [Marinobacter daepoensis]|uniref:Imm26 family immunity protein n=1 Tax=Marinobacter daepoensis TaxID=262077 RepID=UPI00056C3AB5|nr:Imm26 family immunity protein [Marinobacter daepoensis]
MYPITPKKPSEIREGDFYYIPLSNGWFACGRLLEIEKKSGRKTKSILVGLHDWTGRAKPTAEDIHNCPIIEQGVMHINSIGHVGGEVIGFKPLGDDGLKPLPQFEAGNLILGFKNLGPLPKEEYEKYSRRLTYGLKVILLLAEKHFVEN